MRRLKSGSISGAAITRRDFLRTVGGGAFVFGTAGYGFTPPQRRVLSGTDFDLEIAELRVNLTGKPSRATVVNGQLPAPLLRWREGDTVTLRVANRLPARSSIHWHGLIVPADMDGVPGLSFDGIPSGGSYAYRFKVNQSGTYWYHAHSRFQEQTGLYGPIVVEPRNAERHGAERDYVILLSDWTDLDPERIFAALKKQSDYFNFRKRTVSDLASDVRAQGWRATASDRRMWGRMRMDPTDLADVSGYAYTYLMNGLAPAQNWTGVFSAGERVRLRFINGSSMSFFDVRIPGLPLKVVAADGQDVEPVTVDEFRISPAETYDVVVQPQADEAYTIFAQSMDRTGYARGTLTPRPGMIADIPPMDPRPLLSMADMGMAHSHGSHSPESNTAHGAHESANASDAGDSAGHGRSDEAESAVIGHSATDPAHASSRPRHTVSPRHSPSEYGPLVDGLAEQVSRRLDDPGIGLRDNGRRVLNYADLHTIGGPIDQRSPAREIVLHLTGHMERFVWSFDGKKFSEAPPLRFQYGERLRITLVNDSMMTHPIHLHGMWSEVESPRGDFQVRKHTVMIHPAQQLSYGVTADALGRWAYHCHLLYHMEAGMFREVEVAEEGAATHRG